MSLSEPREFVAQGDRVLVVGFARGKVKATNKPFEDDWIFAITVRDGKLTNIREYVDTQACIGAGRAGGRVRAGVALAVCGDRSGVDGERPWIVAPHAALPSNAQP